MPWNLPTYKCCLVLKRVAVPRLTSVESLSLQTRGAARLARRVWSVRPCFV